MNQFPLGSYDCRFSASSTFPLENLRTMLCLLSVSTLVVHGFSCQWLPPPIPRKEICLIKCFVFDGELGYEKMSWLCPINEKFFIVKTQKAGGPALAESYRNPLKVFGT